MMERLFALAILWIVLLLALWGCIYFARRLFIACRSEQGVAFIGQIIRESRTYAPALWRYKAVVRVSFQGRAIEQKLSFWMRKRATVSPAAGDAIPVLIHTSKQGDPCVFVRDSKPLLMFLTYACGLFVLIFGLVIGLAIVYAG